MPLGSGDSEWVCGVCYSSCGHTPVTNVINKMLTIMAMIKNKMLTMMAIIENEMLTMMGMILTSTPHPPRR